MPDNDPNLMTIFAEALERSDPAARAAYLDAACEGNDALRRRVEALLAAHDGAGRFLEPDFSRTSDTAGSGAEGSPGTTVPETHTTTQQSTRERRPDGTPPTTAGPAPADRPGGPVAGQVIAGRYTLLDVLGEGGMGTVYRAGQTEPVKRQVALKLIKIGMDSRTVLARFDAERQALALMDHPNIARVYDGGTTAAGQPFFVMELVSGVPITEYCDRHRLSVQARLELFVTVCQAVQHAHQKGIIHRDLKPGNVLVTEVDGRPTPKVIDFGVARATEQKLTDLSLVEAGAIVGTPAYMSPEQADPSSMDIDTRTDVYALGVILYELLAGSPPIDAKHFRRGAFLEMLRMVREIDPPRPSTRVSTSDALPSIAASRGIEPSQLKQLLRGDLDWIVMKALEKDRARRYETANGFAADVLRNLAHEPVLAAPPSRAYRVRKFVRKHRGAVVAVSVVYLALLAGSAGTTWGLIRAELRRMEAEKARIAEVQRVKERDTAVRVADARADELRYRLGVSDMVLAAAAYDNRDVVLAAERLDNVPPNQRGWEWHYLKRLARGGLYTLYGHTGGVNGAAFSPDGSRIVTASEDRTAKIWDARTGALRLELKGHMNRVTTAVYSPDGNRIVTASADQTAKVWDAQTGQTRFDLVGHTDGVSSAAFNADGSRIVTTSGDGTTRVWDALSGKSLLQLKGHRFAVNSAAFSPDGSRIVTASADRTAKVWDARTGTALFELKGHAGGVNAAAFSADGSRIVTASNDAKVKVWDARTGTALIDLEGHLGWMATAAFSPDGSRIVTAGGGRTAKVWDAHPEPPQLVLKGHAGQVLGAAFSPDGSLIVAGGRGRTARVWDARTGVARLELKGYTRIVEAVWCSADGTQIVTGRGSAATVWDARTGRELTGEPIPPLFWPGPISPDGRLIAHPAGNRVELVPLQPDAVEISHRRIRTQPDLWRYRDGYDAAHAVHDDFAARFYLKLLPPPEREQREAIATAEREIAAGRTRAAIRPLVTASAGNPEDTTLALRVAALQAWFGQDRELADTCRRALEFAKGTVDFVTAEHTARVCCLRSTQDSARRESALALAREAVQRGKYDVVRLPLYQMTLGMAEYRDGHWAAAEAPLIAAPHRVGWSTVHVEGTSAFYRAMSLFRRGKEEEGRRLAAAAASRMKPLPKDEENPLAGDATTDDLILWMAYKEAKSLISFEPPPTASAQPAGK